MWLVNKRWKFYFPLSILVLLFTEPKAKTKDTWIKKGTKNMLDLAYSYWKLIVRDVTIQVRMKATNFYKSIPWSKFSINSLVKWSIQNSIVGSLWITRTVLNQVSTNFILCVHGFNLVKNWKKPQSLFHKIFSELWLG